METSATFTPDDAVSSWARVFLRETLDHWWEASVRPSGLFHPYLDREWNALEGDPLTLVSQCRLIYNFSRGHETFGDARSAEAASRGLDALHASFRLAPGLYRWAVHGNGTEADPTPDAYGHAFCILAHATAARALGDNALAARALETWDSVAATLTDRWGGLLWRLDGPQAWADSPRSQNPMMHTFEALMALDTVDGTGAARAAAQTVLDFLGTLSDFAGGRLVERCTPDWQPLPVDEGGVIDLGHAFEWAWLLSEWHRITGDPAALETGSRFLHTGVTNALADDGGVFEACAPDGQVISRTKGLWQQCEAVRALRRYTVAHGRTDLADSFQRSLSFYRNGFVDAEHGGVFAAVDDAGRPADRHKGDAWKLDYHSAGLCLELIGAA